MQDLTAEKAMAGFSLLAAPLLFASSTFFWQNGEYSTTSATLIVLSMFFWMPAFKGLFEKLSTRMPRYARWGYWVAIWGCISGICFAMLGYLATAFAISHETYLQTLSHYPVSSQLLLFASGPIFPLSLLILGINLLRTKTVTTVVGLLLCAGALAFPVSRISRIEWIAHVADALLIIPCIILGLGILQKSKKQRQVVAA